MAAAKVLLVVLLLAFTGMGAVDVAPKRTLHADEVTGHFTQKNKVETVWLVAPQINADETGCVTQSKLAKQGDCIASLNFSDSSIPSIKVNDCIGGTPVNLGDLDNDGLDEIGLLPEWFTSCWRNYRVYTYKKGEWILAVDPFPTHCNQWEENLQPIIKDPAKKGNVIITYSAFEGNEIVFKKKSVGVK